MRYTLNRRRFAGTLLGTAAAASFRRPLEALAQEPPIVPVGGQTPEEGGSGEPLTGAASWYSPRTGHNVREPFYSAWMAAGGLDLVGMPLSEERYVTGTGGVSQTFEALTLVYNPTFEGEWQVQGAHLDNDTIRGLAPGSARKAVDACQLTDCQVFADSRHTVSGDFLSFWSAQGGMATIGLPRSEAFTSAGVTQQVFEKAVLVDGGDGVRFRAMGREVAEAAGLFETDQAFYPAPPQGGKAQLVSATDGLNLRSGPSSDADVIAMLAENVEFIAAPGATGGWIPGYGDGYSGWVSAEFLTAPRQLDTIDLSEWKLEVWQGASLGETNVRAQPATTAEIVRVLQPREPVEVTAWVKGEEVYTGADLWAQVGDAQYVYARNVGRTAPVAPTPIPANAPMAGRWIDVNLTQQLMIAYEDATPIRNVVMTSGMAGWETPPGSFAILNRVANETMDSGAIGAENFYKLEDVLFTQYFTEVGHAIHFAWWRTPETIGRPGSHGCLNLLLDDARFFWDWANYGTAVIVHY